MGTVGRAVVLGGGGVTGAAWTAGVLAGLADAGVRLTDADAIIGTSTGAVVAATLAHGGEPRAAAEVVAEAVRTRAPGADLDRAQEAIMLMCGAPSDPAQARATAGRMALGAAFDAADEHRGGVGHLLPYAEWPARRLLVTAVRAADGAFAVLDAGSGVPLPQAVAASSAVPCAFPPVEINGLRYFDGAARSPTNADLAAGAATVVVIEPLAHLRPRPLPDTELARLRDARIHLITPDQTAVAAFGADLLAPATTAPAYTAGHAQATTAAPAFAEHWA